MAEPTASASPVTEHPAIDLTHRQKMMVMLAVLMGLFLSALDQTVVGTALPRIVSDLHGNNLYVWVVTAYLLTSTITVPIYGKFGDVFGRKLMLTIGIVIFLGGSALCGLAVLFRSPDAGNQTGMNLLIAFRAIQGIGAGAMFPISLAVIGDLFTPRERGRYQGLFGAVFGLSFLIGPFLGGFITDTIGWQWVFYVNLPIGIASLVVIEAVLPNIRSVAARIADLDYLGIVVFTAGVIPLLLGLTYKGLSDDSGQLYPWLSFNVSGLIGIGLAIIAVFLLIEARAQHPIIPLDLFTNRTVAASNVAVFMVMCGMFSAVIFIPRYFQFVRGISATASGYSMWPLLLGLISSSIGAGILVSRTGRYKLILVGAMALLTFGMFLMTHLQADTPTAVLWLWMACVGFGIGPSMSVFTVVIQNAVSRREMGVATSTMTFIRQIGGTVGLAVAGSLFSGSLTQKLPGQLAAAGVPPQVVARVSSGFAANQNNLSVGGDLGATLLNNTPPAFRQFVEPYVSNIVDGIHRAFALAAGEVFWMAVAASALAFLASLFVRELALRSHEPVPAEAATPRSEDAEDNVAVPAF